MNSIFFIFNFFINAVFVFLTTAFLVEILLFVLRIKNYRLKCLARMVILFKLLLDLGRYNFSSWGMLEHLHPIYCEKGSRILTAFFTFHTSSYLPFPSANLFFHFQNGKTFSIADILIHILPSCCVLGISIFFLFLILLGTFKAFSYYRNNILFMKKITKHVISFPYKIDPKIQKKLTEKKVFLKLSKSLSSPCFMHYKKKMIIFPQDSIGAFTLKEIEAIISHELEHLFWKDGFFHFFLTILYFIFCYIPFLKKWMQKITIEKEYACDQHITVNYIDLATALQKCSFLNLQQQCPTSFVSGSFLKKRIHMLLSHRQKKFSKFFSFIQGGMLLIALFAILFGKFWIF